MSEQMRNELKRRRRSNSSFHACLSAPLLSILLLLQSTASSALDKGCLSRLASWDKDGDSQLNRFEYVKLANDLSGIHAYQDVFELVFDELPKVLQDNFNVLACECDDVGALLSSCCSDAGNPGTIDLAGIHEPSWDSLLQNQQQWVERICDDTRAAIELDLQNLGRADDIVSSRQATPAPTPTINFCFISLTISDGGDGQLTAAEFLIFVNSVAPDSLSWATYTSLPASVQAAYSSRSTNGSVNIQGTRPGQPLSSAQDTFLRGLCSATFLALNDQLVEMTPAPTPTAGSVPTSISPTSGDTTPGPTISINLCFVAMAINDADADKFLNENEYAKFVRQISGQQINIDSYADLPSNLQTKYIELAIVGSGINVNGARPSENVGAEQEAFLQKVCLEVDEEVAVAVDGGVAPTTPPPPVSTPGGQPVSTRPPFGFPTANPPPASSPPPTPSPFGGGRPPFNFGTPAPNNVQPAAPPTPFPLITPAPVPLQAPPPSPPPTLPPIPAPIPLPSPLPTVKPTPFPSPQPSPSPTQNPTPAPTEFPTPPPTPIPDGILYVGNTTFMISNSALFDEDHLISGKVRSSLSRAFSIVSKNVVTGLQGRRNLEGDAELSLLRGGSSSRRRLAVLFKDARVYLIKDTQCPTGVPDKTLCQICDASFTVNSINEKDNVAMSLMNAWTGQIETAIQDGELQKQLDIVNPDSDVVIEEGDVKSRGKPPGYYSVGGMSNTTIAIIGGCVCLGLPVLYCLWQRCCTCFGGGSSKPTPKEIPVSEAPKPKAPAKKGWFS
jgi:hypothetical protein